MSTAGDAGEPQQPQPICGGRWGLTRRARLACRNPAPELVSLHGACRHDRHPVGVRLQREDQTAAEHLPGGCLWRCQGAKGGEGALRSLGEGWWLSWAWEQQHPGSSGDEHRPGQIRQNAWGSLLTWGCFLPQNIHVCLGGLFVPEAYITATRQYVAQANSWSLEELCLEVNVTTSQSATLDACSFGVTGALGSENMQTQRLWLGFPEVPLPCSRPHWASTRSHRWLAVLTCESELGTWSALRAPGAGGWPSCCFPGRWVLASSSQV